MNLQNYYYYFQSALTPRFCDELVKYGIAQQEQLALTGGQTEKINKDKDVNYHFNGDIKPWGKKSFDEAFNSCFFKCFINKNGIKGVIFLKRLFSLYTKILNQN